MHEATPPRGRSRAIRRLSIAAVCGSLAIPVGSAVAAPSIRTISDWSTNSLTFSGQRLAYSKTSAAFIPDGRYTIYRTDAFHIPVTGARFTGRPQSGMILRTSAGRTTGGPMSGDGSGRYLITATGRNFLPQLVLCCASDQRDHPVEARGEVGGPVTLSATLDGKVVRYVLGYAGGENRIVSYHVAEGPGEPFTLRQSLPLGGDLNRALVAMAPGIVAWVDRSPAGSVHLATFADGAVAPSGDLVIPQDGRVVRLHVSRSTVVTVVRDPLGYRVVRHDGPDFLPTIVWQGVRPPGPTALGDRTVAVVSGNTVLQHVIGGNLRGVMRLKGKAVAVATDGTRIAAIDRQLQRVGKRKLRRSVISLTSVRQPPGPYVPAGGLR